MHKNNYFCNFLSKNYFFIEKNLKRNFGCRPADIQNPVLEARWREIDFLQFYQKICKKSKIWSDKVLTHGISFFKAQQFIILAVSRNEKQIFVAVIWPCRPAVGRPT